MVECVIEQPYCVLLRQITRVVLKLSQELSCILSFLFTENRFLKNLVIQFMPWAVLHLRTVEQKSFKSSIQLLVCRERSVRVELVDDSLNVRSYRIRYRIIYCISVRRRCQVCRCFGGPRCFRFGFANCRGWYIVLVLSQPFVELIIGFFSGLAEPLHALLDKLLTSDGIPVLVCELVIEIAERFVVPLGRSSRSFFCRGNSFLCHRSFGLCLSNSRLRFSRLGLFNGCLCFSNWLALRLDGFGLIRGRRTHTGVELGIGFFDRLAKLVDTTFNPLLSRNSPPVLVRDLVVKITKGFVVPVGCSVLVYLSHSLLRNCLLCGGLRNRSYTGCFLSSHSLLGFDFLRRFLFLLDGFLLCDRNLRLCLRSCLLRNFGGNRGCFLYGSFRFHSVSFGHSSGCFYRLGYKFRCCLPCVLKNSTSVLDTVGYVLRIHSRLIRHSRSSGFARLYLVGRCFEHVTGFFLAHAGSELSPRLLCEQLLDRRIRYVEFLPSGIGQLTELGQRSQESNLLVTVVHVFARSVVQNKRCFVPERKCVRVLKGRVYLCEHVWSRFYQRLDDTFLDGIHLAFGCVLLYDLAEVRAVQRSITIHDVFCQLADFAFPLACVRDQFALRCEERAVHVADLACLYRVLVHVPAFQQARGQAGHQERIGCVRIIEHLYGVLLAGCQIVKHGREDILQIFLQAFTEVSDSDLSSHTQVRVVDVGQNSIGYSLRNNTTEVTDTTKYILKYCFGCARHRCVLG